MPTQLAAQPVSLAWLKRQESRLPVCPLVFTKLMKIIQSSSATNTGLGEVISLDPALLGQVLKVANSAFYGCSRNVCSVEDAILRLGYNEVWTIASALNIKKAFGTVGGWSPLNEAVWEHSLRVSVLARMLGAKLNHRSAETFFTAGLLHDLGKLLLQIADADYGAHTRDSALHGPPLGAFERAHYGTTHAAIGAELLDSWNLPAPVVRLVEHHHEDPFSDAARARASAAFAVANEIARDADWKPDKGMTALGPGVSAHTLVGLLGLAPQDLESLGRKARDQVVHLLESAA